MNDGFKPYLNDLINIGANEIRGFGQRISDPGFISSFGSRVSVPPNP